MSKITDKQIDRLNNKEQLWETALAGLDEAIENIKLTIEYLKR